jgi:hypothetical protein
MQSRPQEMRVDDVDLLHRDQSSQGQNSANETAETAEARRTRLAGGAQAVNSISALSQLFAEEAILEHTDGGPEAARIQVLDEIRHEALGPAGHEGGHEVQDPGEFDLGGCH